eukprot:m.136505 g.136505  ORF g.136505 m.136505 type:complete len:769 (-) comp23960_c0_seq4:27-2333(-)
MAKEEFNPTPEELQSIEKALKDAEFRKLLLEYAEEISNPENRQKYEEEIATMEAAQGNDVKFIRPEPGFVVKTSLQSNGTKVFINVAKSTSVDEPTAKKSAQDGKMGTHWSLPHSLAPHRDDLDKAGKKCIVYDAVFHPQAISLASADKRFKDMVVRTAMEAIESHFPAHHLNRDVIKFPKMEFKGTPTATMLRSPKGSNSSSSTPSQSSSSAGTQSVNKSGQEAIQKLAQEFAKNQMQGTNEPVKKSASSSSETAAHIPGSAPKAQSSTVIRGNRLPAADSKAASQKKIQVLEESINNDEEVQSTITPEYKIVHQSKFDLQQYRNDREAAPSSRPDSISVSIYLPLCPSARGVDLDVSTQHLTLHCDFPGPYHLELDLPFPVEEDKGKAKFDTAKHKLQVTLPVLPVPKAKPFTVEEIQKQDYDKEKNTENENNNQNNEISEKTGNREGQKHMSDTEQRQEDPAKSNLIEGKSQEPTSPASQESFASSSTPSLSSTTAAISTEASSTEKKTCATPPAFRFNQTKDFVSVVIDTPHPVSADTVQLEFTEHDFGPVCTHSCTVRLGVGSDQSVLVLRFDAALIPSDCSYDVSDSNVVLKLRKETPMTWHRLQAGSSPTKLQQHYFVSLENVDLIMTEIDQQTPPPSSASGPMQVDLIAKTEDEAIFQLQERSSGPVVETNEPTQPTFREPDHQETDEHEDTQQQPLQATPKPQLQAPQTLQEQQQNEEEEPQEQLPEQQIPTTVQSPADVVPQPSMSLLKNSLVFDLDD